MRKEDYKKLRRFMKWLEENYPNIIDEFYSETGGY